MTKTKVATEIRWCRITQSGLLRFDGPDALSFLQGQLTNNINELSEIRSQYTGYCTPKGRLLASPLLWQRGGAYFMMLPRELCEPVRKRLSMYILRAKVKAADISAEYKLFGLTGAGAAALAGKLAGAAPAHVHEVTHGDEVSVLRLPVDRFLVVATLAAAPHIDSALAAEQAAMPETLWSTLNIDAGIPVIVAATQEQFVPQTVNFDRIGAVSFDKGCYPGQEIVARTHYLGKAKQCMVRGSVVASEAPAPGDKLYSQAYGDQSSGMIVSAVSAGNRHEVLAVVQTSSIEKSDVRWKAPDGPALLIGALPYAEK